MPHYFVRLDTKRTYRFIRLKIIEVPFNQPSCISALRIFEKGSGQLAKKALEENLDLAKIDKQLGEVQTNGESSQNKEPPPS